MSQLRSAGFTLIELAIVLVIVGLLCGGVVTTLATQLEQRHRQDTIETLRRAREALLGFVASQGRLPCPALFQSNGYESPSGGGVCRAAYDGLLPAATLGLAPVDAQGQLLDGWGHPIHYAVSQTLNAAYTSTAPNSLKDQVANLGISKVLGDLRVCASAIGANGENCHSPTSSYLLTDIAAAVVFSLGSNGNQPESWGSDEFKNHDPRSPAQSLPDRMFVAHDPTVSGGVDGQFDDMVLWLSPYELHRQLIQAGQLP
jgi:prepilin-type N-terminal cleavage/methylation domain-containing protein